MANLNIINQEDKNYYNNLYKVGLYSGANVDLVTFNVYANYEQQALEIVVAYAELHNPGLLMSMTDMETYIGNDWYDEFNNFMQERADEDVDELTFANEYLNYVYVDATEYGASQPYYVSFNNLVIEEISENKVVENKENNKVAELRKQLSELNGINYTSQEAKANVETVVMNVFDAKDVPFDWMHNNNTDYTTYFNIVNDDAHKYSIVIDYDKKVVELDEEVNDELLNENNENNENNVSYTVNSYYDELLRVLEDDIKLSSWDEVIDYSHNKLMNGNVIKIKNNNSGKEIVITPDEYKETFDGEFIINSELLESKENNNVEELLDLLDKVNITNKQRAFCEFTGISMAQLNGSQGFNERNAEVFIPKVKEWLAKNNQMTEAIETPENMKTLADKKDIKEYRYITNHGVGPGTMPKDTYIRSEDLDNGKTAVYLNRPLTQQELDKYDIKPEWIQESKEVKTSLPIYNGTDDKLKDMAIELHSYVEFGSPKTILQDLKKAIQDNTLDQYLANKAGMTDNEITDFKNKYTLNEDEPQEETLDENKIVEDNNNSLDGKDVTNTFKNYKAFEANFEPIRIVKNSYDKNYKVYRANETEANNYIYYSDNKDNIEGWLYGAVQAANGIFKKLENKNESIDESTPDEENDNEETLDEAINRAHSEEIDAIGTYDTILSKTDETTDTKLVDMIKEIKADEEDHKLLLQHYIETGEALTDEELEELKNKSDEKDPEVIEEKLIRPSDEGIEDSKEKGLYTENNKSNIETAYAQDRDLTFILETITDDNGNIVSTEVKGFYFGRPNEETTKQFINKGLKATFDTTVNESKQLKEGSLDDVIEYFGMQDNTDEEFKANVEKEYAELRNKYPDKDMILNGDFGTYLGTDKAEPIEVGKYITVYNKIEENLDEQSEKSVYIKAYGKIYYELSESEFNELSEDKIETMIEDTAYQATEEEGHTVETDEVEILIENKSLVEENSINKKAKGISITKSQARDLYDWFLEGDNSVGVFKFNNKIETYRINSRTGTPEPIYNGTAEYVIDIVDYMKEMTPYYIKNKRDGIDTVYNYVNDEIQSNEDTLLEESEQSKESSTIVEELNTSVLPIVDVDMYSLNDYLADYDVNTNELDDIVLEIAPKYIEETIKELLPNVSVVVKSVYHPREYNFSGDELDFTLKVDKAAYDTLKDKTVSDENFAKFLKDNYSSTSGFISTMADNIDDFHTEDTWKQLVQVLMYNIPKDTIDRNNDNYMAEFLEKVGMTFPMIDDDEDNLTESVDMLYASDNNTYVAKNNYGYTTLALIVDDENKQFQLVSGQSLRTGKYPIKSKKELRNMANKLLDYGYTEYKGYGSVSLNENVDMTNLTNKKLTEFKKNNK